MRANQFLRESIVTKTFYHGRSKVFDKFTTNFVGKGVDRHGPGIYLTDSKDEAATYGTLVYTVEAQIDSSRMMPELKRITPALVQKLINSSPECDVILSNFADTTSAALRQAVKQFYESCAPNQYTDLMMDIWYDFYRDSAPQFLAHLVKLGWDGILRHLGGRELFVCYNPAILKIVGVENTRAPLTEDFNPVVTKRKCATELTKKLDRAHELMDLDEAISALKAIDPSSKHVFTDWLVRIYSTTDVNLAELTPSTLKTFETLRAKRIIQPPYSDINHFKTWASLVQYVHSIRAPASHSGNVTVTPLLTKEAAVEYGYPNLCTAREEDNRFDEYAAKGTLYAISVGRDKYQAYVPYATTKASVECTDLDDQAVDPVKLIIESNYNPILTKLFKESYDQHLAQVAEQARLDRLKIDASEYLKRTAERMLSQWAILEDLVDKNYTTLRFYLYKHEARISEASIKFHDYAEELVNIASRKISHKEYLTLRENISTNIRDCISNNSLCRDTLKPWNLTLAGNLSDDMSTIIPGTPGYPGAAGVAFSIPALFKQFAKTVERHNKTQYD